MSAESGIKKETLPWRFRARNFLFSGTSCLLWCMSQHRMYRSLVGLPSGSGRVHQAQEAHLVGGETEARER